MALLVELVLELQAGVVGFGRTDAVKKSQNPHGSTLLTTGTHTSPMGHPTSAGGDAGLSRKE